MPTLDSRVKVNPDVLFQDLHGEAVLLDLKSGIYFGLDSVGTRIWQLFAEYDSLSDIARVIKTEYDVAEDNCAADLIALVAELERHGLLTIG